MRLVPAKLRRVAAVWAISYLVALNAIIGAFLAVQPVAALAGGAGFDPAAYLCHGGVGDDSGGAPAGKPNACAHDCCLGTAPAIAPSAPALSGGLRFSSLVVRPAVFAIGRPFGRVRAGLSRAPPYAA
jgi:hypothetical protein